MLFTLPHMANNTYPVVLSWCLTSSKNSSTSFMSVNLFQFFFLFLLTRFRRLLIEAKGSEVDFKLIKPGCEATTRLNLLADAMLSDRKETRLYFFFFFFFREVTTWRHLKVTLRKCYKDKEML